MSGDHRHHERTTTKARPQSLPDAEAKAMHDVGALLTNTLEHEANPETAYQALRSDYKDFKKTHNAQQVQRYVSDLTTKFKHEGWLPNLAVAFGFNHEYGKGPDARISDTELATMSKDKDPLTAALARELKANVESLKKDNLYTKQEGGFFGIGSHDAPGLGRDDLNARLDNMEHDRRTLDMGNALLDGGSNSLLNRVARASGKNPDDSNQPLRSRDFREYYANNYPKLSARDRELLTKVIENWGNTSLNSIADHFDGATILSKKSIANGLRELKDSPD
jgi:hypothetical protein